MNSADSGDASSSTRPTFFHELLHFISNASSNRLIGVLVAIYLVMVTALSIFDFFAEREKEFARLDATMQAAGDALDQVLGLDFHDRYTPATPPTPAEYQRIKDALSRFARHLDLEYVYSMTKIGSQIYFVASNETRDDTLRHTPSRFYNPYPSPPAALVATFDENTTTARRYARYTNIWDSFYSIFIPRTTPSGKKYVLAADIKLEDQRAILARCLYHDAALTLLLLVPLLPLILLQRRLIHARNEMTAKDKAHIAELRKMNAELEDAVACRTAELTRAMIDLKSFSYTASHDLRAPLNAISGFSQILRESAASRLLPGDIDLLDHVVDASNRMSKLIESLLRLASVPNTPLARDPLDISALACEVVAELDAAGSTHGAEVSIAEGVSAVGDGTLMRLVLQNLFSNAFKYSKERTTPRVSFKGGTDNGADWFLIRDNGEGFDPTMADRLFKPFQRLHGNEFDGFGIGLTHVARIVEKHGGSIEASGEIGQGASFKVTIPRAKLRQA